MSFAQLLQRWQHSYHATFLQAFVQRSQVAKATLLEGRCVRAGITQTNKKYQKP